jgi:cobyrinic acid a,c-diamide synthase
VKALVIAGTSSGSGKTTVSLALMAALRRRGLTAQAFKVGPDFIDPGHHALATGRPSHNLDGWMLDQAENRAIFSRGMQDAQLGVVEGVMGLYDGFSATGEQGSTAQMAKMLGLPVLLTAGARSMARSFAALVGGYLGFDPGVDWAGVVANQVGGPGHARILAQALELVPSARLAGCLPRRDDIALPERHLGLVTAQETTPDPLWHDCLADWLEQSLDLDRLLEGLPEISPPPSRADPQPPPRARLAVARDQAFCFYYQENLRRLRQAGAELVFFSPLADPGLPPDVHGLYLGGGYPELYAGRLADNPGPAREIARLALNGMPVYAECGGMMYLGRELEDLEGRRWPMAGLLPLSFRMLPRFKSLGYRQVRLTRDSPLGPAGAVARGHEFHYSEISKLKSRAGLRDDLYQVWGRNGTEPACKGFGLASTVASYVHLHFGSSPETAPALVRACAAWRDRDA